jgi:hypothetical protein
VAFRNGDNEELILDLAASDEGVAFRYRFPGQSTDLRVVRAELTGFHIPTGARGWLQPYHAASDYTPAYEDFFYQVTPGDPPPRSRQEPRGWCFPALFQVREADSWMLITETSGNDPFPGCHLAADSKGGLYQIAFPEPDEHSKGQPRDQTPHPRFTLPWAMPWRVMILGQTPGGIATSTLVTDLAPPSRIADTSWIKPGRASWAWWSHPDGPFTEDVFNGFTDLAGKMGWEYTLFYANWWKPGIASLASHAKSRGVEPMVWLHAPGLYDARERSRKLDELVANGVRGLKADFWCSDRQETLGVMRSLFEEAAQRKLLVNLHGCTLPRGWHRTWPNFMTAEAVLGAESYFYESRYPEKAAELNTVLPFTRNVAGPMDYTPVAVSPKKYPRLTTAAHELATAILFTSGLIHYADQAAVFERLPEEAVRVLRDAPARWDETRCLVGVPGRVVVFARRSSDSWFIAGINGTGEPLIVDLDMTPFEKYQRRVLIAEGKDANQEVASKPVAQASSWQHAVPARGGFILRLDP